MTKNIGNCVKNDVNPSSIQEEGNKLYMYDVSNGLLEFDLYGTYEKRTLLLDIQKVIVQSQLYFCLKKGRLYLYNSKNFSTVLFQLDKEIKDFTIYKNQLYILAEGKVFRYDLK